MYKKGQLLSYLLAGAMLCGCMGKPTAASAPMEQEGNYATAFATDSFKYSQNDGRCHSEAYIDYPVAGESEAVEAVRTYIKSTLFEGALTHSDDPLQMVRDYCTHSVERQRESLRQMGWHEDQVSGDDMPEEGIEMRKVWQTDRLVTYEVYRFSYFTDGGHGEYSEYGVTWRLDNGRRLDGSIITHVDERLFGHIAEGLKNYFEVDSDEQLAAICHTDLSLMPMPTFPPYLVENGVRFHYSIYDICPFEWGDPAFTLPYDVMEPYLSEEARRLVGEEALKP